MPGWGGHYFRVFSSGNLANWTDEGIMLDLKGSMVPWATGNAWAPAIIERKEGGGYKYYFMRSVDDTGSPNYHVAYGTADNPLGPIKPVTPTR